MPIGVPKVFFPFTEDEEDSWVDVYNRLYRERFLFLGQEAEGETSNQIMGLMVVLSIDDPTRDLYLFINSPGGGVISGIGVYDTMQLVPAEVHTICLGVAASIASLILLGGTIPKRLACPNSRVMIHQPASSFFESPCVEFLVESDELIIVRENLVGLYVQRTGQPTWIISEDLERDIFMSPTEAQAHGIVDHVGLDLEIQ
uniref:ATP-dependent protease subunit n=1 Tax=Chorispora sibirica TaxID=282603 RepID=UPI0026E1F131|nr:ATP-dependent protease subunit [Chorispora sibirica]YP_010895792.1 ATP-dependent protease subunit [Chorispora songarica]WJZ19701.1 ATP-dependent protease subunit [Chorispora sibirica]WJZ19780.1 ATP-dependent protease subunit [Chorispora songarica]